ncbi:MAG: hypothetical protein CW338_05730, partial [Clostridiales bacterium]|nr:hypothetical protein [Clostridiales bacterium]
MSWKQMPCTLEKYNGAPGGHLYLGDNMQTDLSDYAGQVQCVYMDPPYLTGEKFVYRCRVGREGWENGKPRIELPTFSDNFSKEEYLSMLRGSLLQAKMLLKETGSLFLHLDSRMSHYARILCDEIFGERNFQNEIVWAYQTGGRAEKHFSRKHDVILFYQMSRASYFDITAVPLSRAEHRQNHMRRAVDDTGRAFRSIVSGGKEYIYYDDDPVYPGDVWDDVSHLQQKDPQRTGYDTQKPIALLDRIIRCSTRPGDLVADLFCGSGTTLEAAALLGRKYIGVDLCVHAVAVAAKRLADKGLRLHLTSGVEGAELDADVAPGIGISDICIRDYSAPGIPPVASGTNGIDRVAAGFLKDGRFSAYDSYVRKKQDPELPEV